MTARIPRLAGTLAFLVVLALGALPLYPANASTWRPPPGVTWQWQLSQPLSTRDMGVDAPLFDIDGFDNPATTVAGLHARGKKAVCYVEVGGWENYRADASRYPASVLGKPMDGWPAERWVDVRQLSLLHTILHARFQMCAAKGFDAVEPDLMDSYSNDTGFPISYADQLQFNRWVAQDVHALGMSVGQKNAPGMTADLVSAFDFAIVEQCDQYRECPAYLPYVQAGKAVLEVEYKSGTGFCARLPRGFSGMAKRLALDSWRVACP